MSDFYSYAPEDVSINIAGIFSVEGVEAETFVNITKVLPVTEAKSTADGQVYRTMRNDLTYDIEITLQQGSRTNEILTLLYNIDQASGRGRFPLAVKDNSGNSSLYTASAWVQEVPSLSFSGTGQTSRVWRLRATDAIIYVGSNSAEEYLSSNVAAIVTALAALV